LITAAGLTSRLKAVMEIGIEIETMMRIAVTITILAAGR
jgi:hypothetical protein